MTFSFGPMPHTEARDRIAGLPLVNREVLDGLLPELRPYAFTITGLDVGDQMARARDMIAAVPGGDQTWEKARKQIAGELREALGGKEAERRAELLLRTHVFRGYAATRYRTLMAQTKAFPYWQYKTHGDGNVRPSHAALNGKIFPAGHEIWQKIFPPWDWGCRCLVVPLTRRAVERLQSAGMPSQDNGDGSLQRTQIVRPELFEATEADLINRSERLPGGQPILPSQTWSQSPWSVPGTVRHTWDLVQKRYGDQPEVLAAFRQWAQKTQITPDMTVSAWLGEDGKVKPKRRRISKPKTVPAPAPTVAGSRNVGEALAIAGIDPAATSITTEQASALIEELKEASPVKAAEKISSITGALKRKGKSVLTEDFIRDEVQAFMDFLPPSVVEDLPKLRIVVINSKRAKGSYCKRGLLELAKNNLTDAADSRETLFHELAHWVHRELPGDHPWVKDIKTHFQTRTSGESIVKLPGYAATGKRDKWWESYMGRIYAFSEEATHLGLEFPTRNLELLANPARLARIWAHSPEAREDIQLALRGLYPSPSSNP